MKKNNINEDVQTMSLILDLLVRTTALENLLISKGIITNSELLEQVTKTAKLVSKSILKSSNVSGDLDKVIEDLVK